MSLTYPQIESFLGQGLFFETDKKERVDRADTKADNVIISEMTALKQMMVSLEVIVGRAPCE